MFLLGITILLSSCSQSFPDFSGGHYKTYSIPADSMAPTLEIGDLLMAQIRDYEPKRGDLVIVKKGETAYVKRVAAIPGDSISMLDGIVSINGQSVMQKANGQTKRKGYAGPEIVNRYLEQFPGEASAHSIYDLELTPQDTAPELKLGNGQYFLLGDNRDNSADSRFKPEESGLGVIEHKQIQGKVLFRFWREGIGLKKVAL